MANELIIKIDADTKNVKAAFDDVRKQTENLDSALSEIGKVSGIAFAALTAEIGLSIAAFKQTEDATRSLTQALQTQGIFTTELRDSYIDIANALELKSNFDDAEIIRSQALTQSLLGQQKVTKDLTQGILDFAAAKGIDLVSATSLVSKSISTSTNALAREGLQLDATASSATKYQKVLEFLQGTYGGQAEAATQGLGALNQLQRAFGNLQEAIGKEFAPVISRAAKGLADFIQGIADNRQVVAFGVSLIAGAAAVTGLITVLALAGKAFLVFNAVLAATGVAVSGLRLAFLALAGATGIGLIVAALSFLVLNWETAWPRMQSIFEAFTKNIASLAGGIKEVLLGAFTLDPARLSAGLDQIKNAFQNFSTEAFKPLEVAAQKTEEKQNEIQRVAANKRESERSRDEARRADAERARIEVIRAQTDRESQVIIEGKQREAQLLSQIASAKSEEEANLLRAQYERQREINQENFEIDQEQRANFAALRKETDDALRADEIATTDAIREEELQKIQATAETERQINARLAQESLQERITARKLEIEDRKRYGVAVATINAALRSTEIQSAKAVSNELIVLTQSKNNTLKSIGKAAAIASITIATAESAVVIAQKVIRALPFPINVPIAAALAGARIAFGAEQIANVNAAQSGALVEGPGRGDTVPFLLEPGELVTPRKNFEEVVSGVQNVRNNKDAEILDTLQQINEKTSGNGGTVVVQGDVLSDESYIDRLVSKISDAIEFRNAKIYGVNI